MYALASVVQTCSNIVCYFGYRYTPMSNSFLKQRVLVIDMHDITEFAVIVHICDILLLWICNFNVYCFPQYMYVYTYVLSTFLDFISILWIMNDLVDGWVKGLMDELMDGSSQKYTKTIYIKKHIILGLVSLDNKEMQWNLCIVWCTGYN